MCVSVLPGDIRSMPPALGQLPSGERPKVVFDASDMTFASPLDLTGATAWAARLRHEGTPVEFALPDRRRREPNTWSAWI